MSTRGLRARLGRLERGTPAVQKLRREIQQLIEQLRAEGATDAEVDGLIRDAIESGRDGGR